MVQIFRENEWRFQHQLGCVPEYKCVYYDFWGSCGWKRPNPQIFGDFPQVIDTDFVRGCCGYVMTSSVHMHNIKSSTIDKV